MTDAAQTYQLASCLGKIGHARESAAKSWLRMNRKPWWEPQEVYRCKACGMWHTARAGKR